MCPICHEKLDSDYGNFCPLCGADMRETVKKCPNCDRQYQMRYYEDEGKDEVVNYCDQCATYVRYLFSPVTIR